MKKRIQTSRTAIALAACLLSPLAFGQTYTGSNTTAVINTTDHVHTITLDRGAAAASGVELTVTYNNTNLALPAAPAPHPEITVSTADLSCAVTTVGTIICGGFAGAWPQTTTVAVRFDIGGTAVPAPGEPVTLAGRFLDGDGAPIVTTITSGSVIIGTEPPTPLTLSYAPTPGPITLPSGNAGTTVSSDIAATAAGNSGTASLTCTAAAGFTVTPSLNFASAGSQNIAVGCTLGASQTTGAINCTEVDGDSPAPGVTRTWTATCPQGGVVPVNPTITTVTPPGAFAMPSGAPGQTVTRPIQFSAAGGAGTGSATIACTATAPVTVAPANQTVTGSAQPAPVNVSIPLTSAAQGPFAVTCVVTDSAGARTDVFDVSAPAGSALPPPSVVPASSLWSQLALIALLAGLGMAVVGFRRS